MLILIGIISNIIIAVLMFDMYRPEINDEENLVN